MPRSSWFRAAGLPALLVGELVAASIWADFEPFARASGVVAWGVAQFPHLARAAVAAVAVLLVLERKSLVPLGRDWSRAAAGDRAWPLWLAVHVAAGAVVAWLWKPVEAAAGANLGLTAAWIAACCVTLAAWCLAFAPWDWWRRAADGRRQMHVAASAAIGLGTAVASLSLRRLWGPLQTVTFGLVEKLLRVFFDDVEVDAEKLMVGLRDFQVFVAPECSGYEGIGLMLCALAVFFAVFRNELRWPQALALVPIGVIAIWFANVVRITALVAFGAFVSPRIAAGGFHSQAGWISFTVVTVGLAWIALHMPWAAHIERRGSRSALEPAGDSSAYLLPLLAMLVGGMLAGALASKFDWFYPIKIGAALAALFAFRGSYGDWRGGLSRCGLGVATGAAVFAMWLALEPPADGKDAAALKATLEAAPPAAALAWLIVRTLGSTLVVPVVEELAFRGYVMRRIMSPRFEEVRYRDVSWLAVGASSALFGLLHSRLLAGTLAGLAFALATRRRDRLQDAVAAHVVANGLIAAWVLVGGQWRLWL